MIDSLFLIVICFFLAAVCFLLARRPTYWKINLYTGAACFTLLGLASLYLGWATLDSPNQVRRFIEPYPGARAVWRTPVAVDGTWSWGFYSTDSPQAIRRFYERLAEEEGWATSGGGSVIVLKKPGLTVLIAFTPAGWGRDKANTQIIYSAEKKSDISMRIQPP